MSTTQTDDELWQTRVHHMGNLNLIRSASKNWNEATRGCGEHTQVNLMQQIDALDDELAMAGKSMAGAA
ncbi:hypothetical protein NVV93_11035 [Pseudomonas sp. LS44]|uniref:hypothetical protein n=1 Tax=Pseudomonas sp. LS44 TaxID=1357074 RepID=UPI00215A52D6|nr:hypothetical protein [Pseudomonas sp. LS44]UVE16165.1 hypothetical protein NVV93_11035 [Pseudomonas sp. LS44]